jgi:broad specificity phosphatase PhoE
MRSKDRAPEQKDDPPLSDKGNSQAAGLVDRLTPLLNEAMVDGKQVQFFSSPMSRAM